SLLDVEITDGNSYVLVASKDGQLCMFKEDEIRAMGRTASGVKSINLKGSEVIGVDISSHGDKVLVLSEKGLGKLSSIDDYRITHRGSSGVKTIKITEKTGSLVAMKVVKGDEDYLAITLNGTVVRSNLEQVRECGRNSIGVKLIDLREKDVVTSLTCLEKIEDENVEENKNETTSEE
ncbi:MAG: DNA gyrase subunit A, partial [Mollicutes bacterium]|nr:DNA gyrase subunit A [Mollicutes bacterium]